MPTHHRVMVLGFLLLGGFCARAATYAAPLLDHHSWRQADTAAISRNFYREHFNIAFPQVDSRGAQPHGYVETGLELFAFVVAAISLLVGFHHESGRILSALLFSGSAMLVWSFVRRRYGEEHGLVAVFLYAFGFPLLLYIERAFMNEALLMFLSCACLAATAKYLDHQRPATFAIVLATSSLIGAIKLPYLIIWAPVVGLFIERYGRDAVRRREIWLLVVVNVGIALAWYWHAHNLGTSTGLSFGLSVKLFDPEISFWPDFVKRISVRLVKDVFGPVGVLAIIAGFVMAARDRRWCELLGAGAFVGYVLLVEGGNFTHDYYQLAVMPITPVLTSRGIIAIAHWLGGQAAERRAYVCAALLSVATLSTFVRLVSAHSWFEIRPENVALCETIRQLSSPTDRIVFAGDNNPAVLFCADRKGWLLPEPDSGVIRTAVGAGARLVIMANAHPRTPHAIQEIGLGVPVFRNVVADVFKPE